MTVEPGRPPEGSRPGGAAVRHVEVFVSRRSGARVQVPCWCFIGADHSYEEWRGPGAAGDPDTATPPGSGPVGAT